MTVEQIQVFIANVVKVQVGGGVLKTSTPTLTPRGLMYSAFPVATNLQSPAIWGEGQPKIACGIFDWDM